MKKDVINEFATKHDLRLVTQEAGFGKVVTGFIPRKGYMFISIDKEVATTKPTTAYQHCDILAIEGKGLKAKEELANWVSKISQKNVEIIKLQANGCERQVQETGTTKYVLSVMN